MKRGSKQWYDSMTVRLNEASMTLFGYRLALTYNKWGATIEESKRIISIMSMPNKRMSNVNKVSK